MSLHESKPVKRKNRRPSLSNKLADLLWHELHTQRTQTTKLGDDFEFTKALVKHNLEDSTLRDLCLLMATTIVDANTECKVTEIRKSSPSRSINYHPFVRDNDPHAKRQAMK